MHASRATREVVGQNAEHKHKGGLVMIRRAILVLVIALSSPFAQAASPFEGYWRTPPSPQDGKSGLPGVLLYVRKVPNLFVVELVDRNMGSFTDQELPAILRDGVLFVGMPTGELGLGFDAERGVLVSAFCRQPCIRIDAATFATLKDAALKTQPGVPSAPFKLK
jgi:hypothetical protein